MASSSDKYGRIRWVALLMVLTVGCGESHPRLYPARGKLLYNGEPAPRAELVFHPQFSGTNWMPVASVEADGTFEASTKVPRDGVIAGRYKITATWHPHGTEDDPGPNRFPDFYADVKTSPLEVEIRPGDAQYYTLNLSDQMQ